VWLAAAAQAGEVGAFDALVGRYRPRMEALARRLCRDLDAADDLVQEAFLRAYEGLPRLRDPACFGGWLEQILRRLVVDWSRQRAREPELLGEMGEEERAAVWPLLGSPILSPEEAVEWRESVALARAGLASLPLPSRLPTLLYYLEGANPEAIANILSLSTAAVKKRISRARRLLTQKALGLRVDQEKVDGHLSHSYYLLGSIAFNQGQSQLVDEYWTKALVLHEEVKLQFYRARFRPGLPLVSCQQLLEAEGRAFERACLQRPEAVYMWSNLAASRTRTGDLAGAQEALHRLEQSASLYPDYCRCLGRHWVRSGRPQEGLSLLRAGLRWHVETSGTVGVADAPEDLAVLGMALAETGHPSAAVCAASELEWTAKHARLDHGYLPAAVRMRQALAYAACIYARCGHGDTARRLAREVSVVAAPERIALLPDLPALLLPILARPAMLTVASLPLPP